MNDDRLQKAHEVSTTWMESFAEIRCKLCDFVVPFTAENGREIADHVIANHIDLLKAVVQASEDDTEDKN